MKSLFFVLAAGLSLSACSDAGEARLNRSVDAAIDSTGNKLERLGNKIDTRVRDAVADARAPKDAVDSANVTNDAAFSNDEKKRSDARWATAAIAGDMLQIQLGELAVTNAAAPAVKEFARAAVAAHSRSEADLRTLVASRNMRMPDDLSNAGRDKLMELTQKTGGEFDRAYLETMVRDHQDAIDRYGRMADKGNDPELRSFAAKRVPVLKQHRQSAEQVQKAMAVGK